MNTHEKSVVVVLGVVALVIGGALTVHGSFSFDAGQGGDQNTEKIPVRTEMDPSHGALRINHSLYHRPYSCGGDRAIVVGHGWEYFANPPSELSL